MTTIGELDVCFGDVKEHLSEEARKLFNIPDYSEFARNLVSMANYLPLFSDLLNAIDPKRICEIGAYRGITTRALLELAIKYDGHVDVVDPEPKFLDIQHEKNRLTYFQMLSEEYLSTHREVDILFIDGDHNYEVVSIELKLIRDLQCRSRSPVLFMHDTGWPCAFRDLYYDMGRIERPHKTLSEPRITLTKPSTAEWQVALPLTVDVAERSGGERNGVRSAIEEFLVHNRSWKFIHLPSLYGLGILWDSKQIAAHVESELKKLEILFEKVAEFASTLELNRIVLLSEINAQGQEWCRQQARIRQLESANGAIRQLAKKLLFR